MLIEAFYVNYEACLSDTAMRFEIRFVPSEKTNFMDSWEDII